MKKLRQHVAFKSIGGIVLLLVVFSIIVSIIGYRTFTEELLSQYADGGYLMARVAAKAVDGNRIDEYLEKGTEADGYQAAWDRLDQFCTSFGATFIYVIKVDRTDYGHITFVFSTVNDDSKYSPYEIGYVRETTNDDYREQYRAIYEQETTRAMVVRDKGRIDSDPHITLMTGIKGFDGEVKAILCVQRQMDAMVKVRHTYLKKILLALLLLSLLVSIGQSALLHRALLRPLELITKEAKRFSSENVTTGKKLQETITNNDEIGQLAVSIDRMEEQIHEYVENLTQITAEKERVLTELNLAARIQEDMLPREFPAFPDRDEFDVWASMDPARQVGGDFYDYFLIDDDHLCLLIADVSGKGIPAALFMMASKIILSANAREDKGPAQILAETNEAICSRNQEEMFLTVWLGILEISTGRLTAANAGHEYPVMRTPGGEYTLLKDKHSFVIGGMEDTVYREYELHLEPGSSLFLYTDGVPEATDPDNSMFGTDRLLEALNEDPGAAPEQVLKNVHRAVDAFVRGAERFDDVTMLCLEYKKV